MVEKLKAVLSLKSISTAIVLLAIFCRIIQLLFFYNLGEDLAYQVLASQNLADGNGISLAKALPGDLSVTTYEALIKWPPGYSLFMYPVYEIFQPHYIEASLIIEIVAAIILIFYTRKILFLLQLPVYLVNVYTIASAFFIHVFYIFPSTDGIGISLIIIALYHVLLLQKSNRKFLFNAMIITICLIAASMLKYLFIPIVFIIPLFFLYQGLIEKNKLKKTFGIITFLILFFSVAGILLYQKSVSGSIAYVRTAGFGFFPEHILSSYPFIPASFIKPDTLPVLTGIASEFVYVFLQILHAILVICFALIFIRWLRSKKFKALDTKESFVFLFVCISLVGFITLLVLSLRIATDTISSGSWTFLQDARYYGLTMVMAQMGVFLMVHFVRFQSLVRKIIPVFLFILLLMEMFRGIGFVSNRMIHFRNEEYRWQHDIRFQKFASEIIEKEKKSTGLNQVVITGSEYLNNRMMLGNSIPRMYDDTLINNIGSLHSTKPVLLIVVIQDVGRERFASFLNNQEVKELGRFDGCSFYSFFVKPG